MAEKATNKVMLKDLNASLLNVLSGQEITPKILEESESKRYMEESNQGTPSGHDIQSSELINVNKSSEIEETDEIDILGYSDEDCAKVEVNFLTTDSEKGVYTSGERKRKAFGDFDIIKSNNKYVLQTFKPEPRTIDSLTQASEPYRLKEDSTTDMLSTDSDHIIINISSRQLNSHQVIEQCMEDLVKNVSDGLYGEVQYLVSSNTEILSKCSGETIQLSEQNTVPSDELNIFTHQTLRFENVNKPSDLQVETDNGNVETGNHKLKMTDFSPSDELKMIRLNKALKDIDLLSSCTEEIGRMNEILKSEVCKMVSELMVILRSIRYVLENLSIIRGFPSCTIVYRETDTRPRAVIDVLEFGVNLLNGLTRLFLYLNELLRAVNEYRLKFIDLSETFAVNPFEFHVGESQNNVLDTSFAAAIKIYKEFFDNERWDILHEHFVSQHEVLQSTVVVEFHEYINKLGVYYGDNAPK